MIESSDLLARDKRMSGLQAARALAACAVALGHAILGPLPGEIVWVEFLGVYGVSLFFVISGYIMVLTTGRGAFRPLGFLLRRALRIVPLYWIACALLAIAVLALPISFRSTTLENPVYVLKSLFFIPDYAPRFPGQVWPFYKLGWTLNLEMFFYVTFAIFAFLAVRARVVATTLVIVGFVAFGALTLPASPMLKVYAYPINLGFAGGMWLALLELPVSRRLTSRFAGLLFGLSMISLTGAFLAFDLYVTHQLIYMIWLLATVILQIAIVVLYVDRRQGLVPRWAVALGDASYSIYLFHMFTVTAVDKVLSVVLPGQYVLAVGLSFVASVVGGVLAHHWLERPIMRRIGHIGRVRPVAPAGAPAAAGQERPA